MNTVCDQLAPHEASRQGGLSRVQSFALSSAPAPRAARALRRSMSLAPAFVKLNHRHMSWRTRARRPFPNAVDVAHGAAPPVEHGWARLPGY